MFMMENFGFSIELLVLIVISILLYTIVNNDLAYSHENMVYVKSTIDNRDYYVKDKEDKQQAANNLSMIRHKLLKLIKYFKQNYPDDERVHRIFRKFKYNNIIENFPSPNNTLTSYSINKGDKMVFCLRQRNEHNSLVDMNTLLFVSLHELAHVMTISIGHEQEFWDNFKFLLKHAIKTGLYKYEPYHHKSQKYCGTDITDTPYKH
jgi:hypothetical protein